MTSILLVDDDPNVTKGLRRSLRQEPYDVCVADSAEQAMLLLGHRTIDLVVMDQTMDGAPGTELAAWIHQRFPSTVRLMLSRLRFETKRRLIAALPAAQAVSCKSQSNQAAHRI